MDISDWMYLLREHGGTLLTVIILLLLMRWFGKLLAERQTVADPQDSAIEQADESGAGGEAIRRREVRG